ncbi:MAG: AMP-dependent synthetase/ligase [Sphingomonadales bacterium]
MNNKNPQTSWLTLPGMFFSQAERYGNKPFLWHKKGERWKALSWEETAVQVAKAGEALKGLGVKPGDRVAILSENRPEWVIADLAIMAIGAIAVPLYTTNTSSDHLHVLENSGAKAVIISTAALLKNFLPAAHESDSMKNAICMEPYKLSQRLNVELLQWWDILENQHGNVVGMISGLADIKRADPAIIIYTSGTGGTPKGVVLHHGSILHNCEGAEEILFPYGLKGHRFLSFLPLSHAYAQTGDLFLPIHLGAEIYFAEGLEKLSSNMVETKPTVMLVVPRLFETIKGRIELALKKEGGAKKKLFYRAVELGSKKYKGQPMTLIERLEDKCLTALVRRKVKKRFGGKIKALVSGGAAMSPDVGLFFVALGINVLQGYGQTETGPLISANREPKIKMDAVGPPVKATRVKIADDGEILVQGELVMKGYWRDPDATAMAIRDGWLHTGDIGIFDEDGHLKITDRKKDIIVFDKGDNVSPQRIEGFLTLEEEIAQAMVSGDARPYLVGLIVPDDLWFKNWKQENGKKGNLQSLCSDPDLKKAIGAAVSRVNSKLSNLERVRGFLIAGHSFTIENEQMTPTMKIRRHIIRAEFGDELDALY